MSHSARINQQNAPKNIYLSPKTRRHKAMPMASTKLVTDLPVASTTQSSQSRRKRARGSPIIMVSLVSLALAHTFQEACIYLPSTLHLSLFASAEPLLAPVLVPMDTSGPSESDQQTTSRQAYFADPLDGETSVQRVPMGRSVKFRCAVNDIGDHKVSWFHSEKRMLLAMDNRTVGWRERVQVSSHANSVFFLQIDNVQPSDKVSLACTCKVVDAERERERERIQSTAHGHRRAVQLSES